MKEFLDQERNRFQAMFDAFVEHGSWMQVFGKKDREPFYTLPVDTMRVTRVQPLFDTAGAHLTTIFWVMWNGPGYDDTFHHTHTIRVAEMEAPDTYAFIFRDDHHIYHFEHLFPDITPGEEAMFKGLKAWREHKAKNAARFEEIDVELLAEHQRIADTWPS